MFGYHSYMPGTARNERLKRRALYIGSIFLVFVVSFVLSYALASGAQGTTASDEQTEKLKAEIGELNLELQKRDETIASLTIQIENLKKAQDTDVSGVERQISDGSESDEETDE